MGNSTNITIERKFDNPLAGTVVKIEGIELPNLTNVEFQHKAGSIAELRADMNSIGPFNITLPAHVQVTITMMPGSVLTKVNEPDGSESYYCILLYK